MTGPAPVLEAQILIDAPRERVWEVVSDLRAMSERSPETFKQGFIGGIRPGGVQVNLNRRKAFVWPTASRIVTLDAPRLLQFYVYGPATMWTFSLSEAEGGTLLTERRTTPRGKPTLLTRAVAGAFLGGVPGHDDELLDGIRATLAAIKAEAEA